jgi:uncharacterized membrane protein YqhA
MKLIASIVANSAIDLLRRMMQIGDARPDAPFSEPHLFWLVTIQLIFVASGVLLALIDWLSARPSRH